jgi:hypothetical protein
MVLFVAVTAAVSDVGTNVPVNAMRTSVRREGRVLDKGAVAVLACVGRHSHSRTVGVSCKVRTSCL